MPDRSAKRRTRSPSSLGLVVVEPGGGFVEQQHRRCRRDRAVRSRRAVADRTESSAGRRSRSCFEPELAGAAHRGRRQGRSGRPDQVAEAGEPRARSRPRRAGSRRPRSPRRARATGTNAARPRAPAGPGPQDRPAIGVSLRRMRPPLGLVKPVMASTMVVFPAPFGPISPTTSRGDTRKLTPSTATTAPNRTVRSSISRVAGDHLARRGVDQLLARRGAAEPEPQLADAPLVVEHDAGDPVRVQDHDEDERDAADGDEPRAEIDPVERDRAHARRARGSHRTPRRAPSPHHRRPRCRPC